MVEAKTLIQCKKCGYTLIKNLNDFNKGTPVCCKNDDFIPVEWVNKEDYDSEFNNLYADLLFKVIYKLDAEHQNKIIELIIDFKKRIGFKDFENPYDKQKTL